MHHESLVGFAFQPVHSLGIVGGAERRRDQRLRFTAREDGRAVSSGQDAGFDPDGPDLIELAACPDARACEESGRGKSVPSDRRRRV